jgi:hypothetical protein
LDRRERTGVMRRQRQHTRASNAAERREEVMVKRGDKVC